MEFELMKTIIFAILLGVFPLLSILNTICIMKLKVDKIEIKFIHIMISFLLLLPSIIIVLSMI
jgi:hypothetical protein